MVEALLGVHTKNHTEKDGRHLQIAFFYVFATCL